LWGAHLVRVYLPGAKAASFRHVDGQADAAGSADGREKTWWALAWPACGEVGARMYAVGPSGKVVMTRDRTPFRGLENPPPAWAAFKEKGPEAARGAGSLMDSGGRSGSGVEWEPAE